MKCDNFAAVFQIFYLASSLYFAHSIRFTYRIYDAYVSADTSQDTLLQQIVALPTIESSCSQNFTYTIEPHEFLEVSNNTGDVVLKARVPPHSMVNGVRNFSVGASCGGQPQHFTTLTLHYIQSDCVCFPRSNALDMSIAEDLRLPYGIFYLNPRCNYTLENNSFSITAKRLMLSLGTSRVHDRLHCGDESMEFNVERLSAPYIFLKGRSGIRRVYFHERNITVDPEQLDPFLGQSVSSPIVFTYNDDVKYLKVRQLNDPIKQFDIGNPKTIGTLAKVKLYSLEVRWAPVLKINSSQYIDVVLVNTALEKISSKNNVTYRFNIIYKNIDELRSLNMSSSYDLILERNVPVGHQILRVLHNLGSSLDFNLSSSEYSKFLSITKHQGIVYVSDSNALASYPFNNIELVVTVSQGSKSRTTRLFVKLVGEASQNQTNHSVSCSSFRDVFSCNKSSGVGTSQCIWKTIEDNRSNYSTCVPADSCADYECSELESMLPGLCPQDCYKKWFGDHKQICDSETTGICEGIGVCFCDRNGQYCQCQEYLSDDDYTDDDYWFPRGNSTNERAGSGRDPYEPQCDISCIVGFSVLGAIALVVVVVLVLFCHQRSIQKTNEGSAINAWRVAGDNLQLTFASCPDYEGNTPTTFISMLSNWPDSHPYHNLGNMEIYDEKWELSRDNLIIEGYIGEGEFGKVMKAKYRKSATEDWLPAAVKMLKEGASRGEFCDLLSEYNLLKEVDHPNVIKLLGAATVNGPFHLVVEYCQYGSLKSYLRKVQTQEPIYVNGYAQFYTEQAANLLDFSWQITKGMQYLSDIKLVHRDLATRNILITAESVVKISDFGMTKDVYIEDAYKKKSQGRIPVKWMAPESLYHQVYTSKSDVWSFGVVLWEIATLGATPYPGIPAERMYQLLQDGYRMDRPETCSQALYSLMRQCWDYEPLSRPTFKDLRISLEKMIEDGVDYIDLSVVHSQRLCSEYPSSSTSEDDGVDSQLTVSLLRDNSEVKFVEDYLVSSNHNNKHRYTVLEFEEDY